MAQNKYGEYSIHTSEWSLESERKRSFRDRPQNEKKKKMARDFQYGGRANTHCHNNNNDNHEEQSFEMKKPNITENKKFSLTVIAWYRNQAKKLAAREVTEWAWEKGHVSGVTWHVTRRAPMRAGAVLAARVTSSTDGQCTSQPSWDEREVRVGDGGTEVKKRRRGVYREVGDRESKGEQVRESQG